MANRQHVIELNGQKYDAVTGTVITSAVPKPTNKAATKAPLKTTPKHLDGFSRRPNVASTKATPVATQVHRKTEKSNTLMRTAVKKPTSTKIHAKAATASVSPAVKPAAPTIMSTIKPGRAIRAGSVVQSNLISKFGRERPTIKTEAIAVKPAPAHVAAKLQPATAVQPKAQTVASQAPAKPDQFQSAIDNAISHQQPKAKKLRTHHKIAKKLHVSPRVVSFASMTILALAIGGFLAYQNLPELAMKVASTRAGLSASLPSYQPAGFSMAGPIKYEPGTVTVNYKSNSDNRAFNVTQKNSSWNSETLLENYVATTKQPYQTFQANGRTIYIYEDNKATWVDGGVWYNIDGKADLNSDQLLRIAGSL